MVLFGFILAFSMLAYVTYANGVLPKSLSDMVFLHDNNIWQSIWALWLTMVSFCVAIPAISVLVGIGKLLGVFMMACLLFTSALPLTLSNISELHDYLAVASGVLSQVIVAVVNPWFLLLWVVFALYWTIDVDEVSYKREVLLAEIICYLAISFAVMFPL